jgi:2-phosphosulfolactate phosphatase
MFYWLLDRRRDRVESHGVPQRVARHVIDVALTRTEIRRCDVAVVIDVLRATSVATVALAAGYERVLCAESVELAETLRGRGRGRVLAGERHCIMPAGFDQGNSPREAPRVRGEELVLATTNGAPAIVAATRLAPQVLLASLLNLSAVVELLGGHDLVACNLQLVCAGTDGAVALEDTYLAGRICAALPGPRTDGARIAEAVARGFPSPLQALSQSDDAQVLKASGLQRDIAFCARESMLDLVPRVISAGTAVSVIAGCAAPAPAAPMVDVPATVEV